MHDQYQITSHQKWFVFFSPAIEVALQIVFLVTTRVEHIRTDVNRSVLLLEEEEEGMHLCN